MANRFKLFLLTLILVVLGILFFQNQQPLSIKLLCPDVNQFCVYQTRRLPVAVWMGLFILTGTITSLIWQLCHRFSYSVATRKNYYRTDYPEDPSENLTTTRRSTSRRSPEVEDWGQDRSTESWDSKPASSTMAQDDLSEEPSSVSSEYEIIREPESVTRSGSTYSYKYKDKDKNDDDSSKQDGSASESSNSNQNINLAKDDEEWI